MKNEVVIAFVASLVLFQAPALETAPTKSFLEKLCEMLRPELKTCRLVCPDGLAWREGCPICACRSDLCQKCAPGEKCTIVQREGEYSNQMTDVAKCEAVSPVSNKDGVTEAPKHTTTEQMVDVERALGTCDYVGKCDSTMKCAEANAVCRSDGLCCRQKVTNNYNIASRLGIARCLEEPHQGYCRGLGVQYVYNKTSGQCNDWVFGGCTPSGNSFDTLEQCKTVCENPCERPKTPGRCRASIPRYYFNEETENCEAFDLGGCDDNYDYYFKTPWDCETHCKAMKKASAFYRNLKVTIEPATQKPVGLLVRENTTPTPTPTPTIETETEDMRENVGNGIISNFRRIPQPINRNNPSYHDRRGGITFRARPGAAEEINPPFNIFSPNRNLAGIFSRNQNRNGANGRTLYNSRRFPSRSMNYRHLGDRYRMAQERSQPRSSQISFPSERPSDAPSSPNGSEISLNPQPLLDRSYDYYYGRRPDPVSAQSRGGAQISDAILRRLRA